MSDLLSDEFFDEFTWLMQDVHANAVKKGFWDEGIQTWGSILMNLAQEIFELWGHIRDGDEVLGTPSEKISEYSIAEEEFADMIIRIMDTCQAHDLRLPEAILAKHKYNKSRPYRHGKIC